MSNSMVLLSFSLSLSVFFMSFAFSSSSNVTHKCSPQQSLDLLLFKQNLSSINHTYFILSCQDWLGSDYHPLMMNWNKNTDCCKWDGVTCNHVTGDVIALDLSCGMLQGTIDTNSTIFRLPHLERLDLSFNDFTASRFPREIHMLFGSLTHLNISYCGFIGEISREILHLPKLVSLDLSWNDGLQIQLYVVKKLVQNSTRLRELRISGVNIGWILPTYLNISSSLKSLDLSWTGLQGKLPANIFNLQYLEKLDFSGNVDLTSPLPKVNTSNNIPLKWLDLSSCGLMGSLPKSLVNLTHLTTLFLGGNMLNGLLPPFLFTLPLIENIVLDFNLFKGGLPLEFFNCRSLKSVSLQSNQFDGEINQGPTQPSFIKLVNLTYLDISMSNFVGVWNLDTLLTSLSNLQYLDLSYSGIHVFSNNSFSYVNPGFRWLSLASNKLNLFPESLRAMKELRHLDLSTNDIHGHIPNWAGEIGGNELLFLNLSNNYITSLPQPHWDGLEELYLQFNQLEGHLPPSICNMRKLYTMDISNNRFSGVIPQCLGNIGSSLGNLNVKSNHLQGPVPSSICNLSGLTYLYMSDNNFDGVMPQCLGNIISSLLVVDMGNNRFHGTIPDVFEECGRLNGLILNGNQLQGKVPSSLSKCQSLMVLDLGNNQLDGTFPGWLGDLQILQVLILKSNKLHGSIEAPFIIGSAFPSMQVLVLSHNKFVGRLPQKYFKKFNAMKNVVSKGSKPGYLSMGGNYYTITTAVKGVELEFPKILVDYVICDLSNNRFEGEIPDVIGSLTSLIVLDLSHNHLTGKIPYVLGNLSKIESLDLSWNQLTREIPQSLANLTFLGFLNLSQNYLKGHIPLGTQFSTFETSFGGNLELCGAPLPKKCEHPLEPRPEVDEHGDDESGFTWRVVMLGYGCGHLVGLVIGYVMLSMGRPRWFNAIVHVGEHMIRSRRNKRKYIYIGK